MLTSNLLVQFVLMLPCRVHTKLICHHFIVCYYHKNIKKHFIQHLSETNSDCMHDLLCTLTIHNGKTSVKQTDFTRPKCQFVIWQIQSQCCVFTRGKILDLSCNVSSSSCCGHKSTDKFVSLSNCSVIRCTWLQCRLSTQP